MRVANIHDQFWIAITVLLFCLRNGTIKIIRNYFYCMIENRCNKTLLNFSTCFVKNDHIVLPEFFLFPYAHKH